MLASEAIESFGYEVETAMDGNEAIDKYKQAIAKETPYDLVIMDLTIPGGMGGKEAIKILKDLDPDIKAIVSSGYSKDHVMANYTEHGFSARLGKPFQIEELRQVISEQLA